MENFRKLAYYGTILLTLGTAWLLKVVIQKAVEDGMRDAQEKVKK